METPQAPPKAHIVEQTPTHRKGKVTNPDRPMIAMEVCLVWQ